ncbi:MAG: hypothetical protein IPL43_02285 [Micropruina sp.]|nr:hypothetical protein [Micropruina sp.]
MEADPLRTELAELPARLRDAVSAGELIAATTWPGDSGIVTTRHSHELRVGADHLISPIPSIRLGLARSVDARFLCREWGVPWPVAVSGDVHQMRWGIVVGGAELLDPYQQRITVEPFLVGCWQLRPLLTGRPPGPVPGLVAGASPAYDVTERGGRVALIEVSRARFDAAVVTGDDPAARQLLGRMALNYPVWHSGWTAEPSDEVALVIEDGRPVAGAVISVSAPVAQATRVSLPPRPDGSVTGSQLLELLESVAMDRGCQRLILDSSAFLHAGLPYPQLGYTVQPPYQGDPDTPVWVQRDLPARPGPR